MIYTLKLIIYTILDIFRHNPFKSILLLISISSYCMLGYVDKYEKVYTEIDRVIIEEDGNGEVINYFYITKSGSSYGLMVKSDPIDINDENQYVYEEGSFPFFFFGVLFVILSGTLFLIFLFSFTESDYNNYNDSDELSWQFIVSYRETNNRLLLKEIVRKEDVSRVYYVLNNKIVKTSMDMEYEANGYELGSFVNKYNENKKILRNFKGTLIERRETEIDKLLEEE